MQPRDQQVPPRASHVAHERDRIRAVGARAPVRRSPRRAATRRRALSSRATSRRASTGRACSPSERSTIAMSKLAEGCGSCRQLALLQHAVTEAARVQRRACALHLVPRARACRRHAAHAWRSPASTSPGAATEIEQRRATLVAEFGRQRHGQFDRLAGPWPASRRDRRPASVAPRARRRRVPRRPRASGRAGSMRPSSVIARTPRRGPSAGHAVVDPVLFAEFLEQARVAQQLEVPRDARLALAEDLREFGDRKLALARGSPAAAGATAPRWRAAIPRGAGRTSALLQI